MGMSLHGADWLLAADILSLALKREDGGVSGRLLEISIPLCQKLFELTIPAII